jgi:hypothetical protein
LLAGQGHVRRLLLRQLFTGSGLLRLEYNDVGKLGAAEELPSQSDDFAR